MAGWKFSRAKAWARYAAGGKSRGGLFKSTALGNLGAGQEVNAAGFLFRLFLLSLGSKIFRSIK